MVIPHRERVNKIEDSRIKLVSSSDLRKRLEFISRINTAQRQIPTETSAQINDESILETIVISKRKLISQMKCTTVLRS